MVLCLVFKYVFATCYDQLNISNSNDRHLTQNCQSIIEIILILTFADSIYWFLFSKYICMHFISQVEQYIWICTYYMYMYQLLVLIAWITFIYLQHCYGFKFRNNLTNTILTIFYFDASWKIRVVAQTSYFIRSDRSLAKQGFY